MKHPRATPAAVRKVWITMTNHQMRVHFGLNHRQMREAVEAAGGIKLRKQLVLETRHAVLREEFTRLAPTMTYGQAARHWNVYPGTIYTWAKRWGVRPLPSSVADDDSAVASSRFAADWSGGIDKALWQKVMGRWCEPLKKSDAKTEPAR